MRLDENSAIPSDMPDVWATIFTASLLAVFGNILYQLFTPDDVKLHSKSSYISERLAEFVSAPSDLKVQAALEVIRSRYSNNDEFSWPDRTYKKSLSDKDEEYKALINERDMQNEMHGEPRSRIQEKIQNIRIELVEENANIDYEMLISERRLWSCISLCLYVFFHWSHF